MAATLSQGTIDTEALDRARVKSPVLSKMQLPFTTRMLDVY
ncbi:conserved hypothetical protein [Mesorhizobium delmotii]|uniref:Uncharacterized protein n=1 Tax=Mesorhizobium delmotii TaxID=1631247 RepID=A0A2P9AN20_9HYPH|nr:conserved hypothetical protein [Mesorhizobium delmotii]